MRRADRLGLACAVFIGLAGPSFAADSPFAVGAKPPSLAELQNIEAGRKSTTPPSSDLRLTAVREAALSYGAQGGLAARGYELNTMLDARTAELSQVFNFRQLGLSVRGGGVIVPPVIAQSEDALSLSKDGMSASSANRVYFIVSPAQISSSMPEWRRYLMRTWPSAVAPREVYRPRDEREREVWNEAVAEGFQAGIAQANAIFDSDVKRLQRDFVGMVLYRKLVALGMIDELYVAEADMGVTVANNGNEMRIGERLVRIASPAKLNSKSGEWGPIVIRDPASIGERLP